MSRYDKEKEGRKVGGGGVEEKRERGESKEGGRKKEGVNVFMLSKKGASLNTGCMPTMHTR